MPLDEKPQPDQRPAMPVDRIAMQAEAVRDRTLVHPADPLITVPGKGDLTKNAAGGAIGLAVMPTPTPLQQCQNPANARLVSALPICPVQQPPVAAITALIPAGTGPVSGTAATLPDRRQLCKGGHGPLPGRNRPRSVSRSG